MAKVERITVKPAMPAVEEVVLVLSIDEARALASVYGRVGGDARYTARRHVDSVFFALQDAGIDSDTDEDGDSPLLKGGSALGSPALYFQRDLTGEVR